MKKLVLALTAVAAFTGSASAADLGPSHKAPVAVAPAYNWTASTSSAVAAAACGRPISLFS